MELEKILQRFSTKVSQWTTGDGGKKPYPFDEAKQALTEWRDSGIAAELETLLEGVTIPEEHFGILSGLKIREYIKSRIAELNPTKERP